MPESMHFIVKNRQQANLFANTQTPPNEADLFDTDSQASGQPPSATRPAWSRWWDALIDVFFEDDDRPIGMSQLVENTFQPTEQASHPGVFFRNTPTFQDYSFIRQWAAPDAQAAASSASGHANRGTRYSESLGLLLASVSPFKNDRMDVIYLGDSRRTEA